jgi:hypothetical protein
MSDILTTVVVTFGDDVDSDSVSVLCEADDTRNLDDDGEVLSTFTEETPYYFLTHVIGDATISKIAVSAGSVFDQGSEPQSRQQVLDFVEIDSDDYNPSVSYQPYGSLTKEWIGNVGSGMSVDSDTLEVNISGGDVPCKCLVTYPVYFRRWMLQPPSTLTIPDDLTTFDIIIAIHVE